MGHDYRYARDFPVPVELRKRVRCLGQITFNCVGLLKTSGIYRSWPFQRHVPQRYRMTLSRSWVFLQQHRGQVRHDIPAVIARVELFAVAEPGKTVFFSSPLYRKNLHYKVIQKPPKESDHLDMMVNYILETYPKESGIVYCTTKLVSLQPTCDSKKLLKSKAANTKGG